MVRWAVQLCVRGDRRLTTDRQPYAGWSGRGSRVGGRVLVVEVVVGVLLLVLSLLPTLLHQAGGAEVLGPHVVAGSPCHGNGVDPAPVPRVAPAEAADHEPATP